MRKDVFGVASYLAIAFGMAWAAWEIPLRLGLSIQSGWFQIPALIGAFAPAVAAAVVRRWVTREGFADAGLELNPRKWHFYLAALLIPLAAAFATAAVCYTLDLAWPDFAPVTAPLLLQLVVFSIVLAPVQWGEEFGWRGYLQMRLLARRPLAAAVATGLIWGIWHYPLLLRGTELPGHPTAILILFPLGTVFYSVILGWLRLRSGSVWPSSLAHSAINHLKSPLTAAIFASVSDKLGVTVVSLVVMGGLALLIAALGGLKPKAEPA